MGPYERLFAALYDPVMHGAESRVFGRIRRELLEDLAGHVVEIGAGTGANLDHLRAGVTRLSLFEPSAPMAERLRRHVARVEGLPADTEVVEAPAEALPLPDDSADVVVSTLVLCTVRDPDVAVAEIRRVLVPGGRLVLLEHVRGTGAQARVQRVIEPAWSVVGRGCRLTRDTHARVVAAGFDVADLHHRQLPLGVASPAVVGTARAS